MEGGTGTVLVRLTGIEPAHTASEAAALSPELQALMSYGSTDPALFDRALIILYQKLL